MGKVQPMREERHFKGILRQTTGAGDLVREREMANRILAANGDEINHSVCVYNCPFQIVYMLGVFLTLITQ